MMDFNLVQLRLRVATPHAERLVRTLPLLGASYSAICRDLVCRRPGISCDCCTLGDSCSWSLLFSQRLSTDPAEVKRHQKPPLPFAFSFPYGGASLTAGGATYGLVVVGSAINHLDLLLDGFSRLLASQVDCGGIATLTGVSSLDFQGEESLLARGARINNPENLNILSSVAVLDGVILGGERLCLEMSSPLRLYDNGHLRQEFDFGVFARSLLRRISSLAYYYGGCSLDGDFAALSRQANAVVCTEYQFSPVISKERRLLSGVVGRGCFHGDFSGLMPFLALGQLVHAGKGAAFGMGAFAIH